MSNSSRCQNPFCMSLEPHVRKNLCHISTSCTYHPKRTITVEIGKNGHLLLIVKGVAITLKQRADGKQLGIECLEKGDIVGISNIFREEMDHAVFYTKKEVQTCSFRTEDFSNLCLSYPDISRQVIRSLSHRFAQAVTKLEHISLDNSTEKIMYLFEKLCCERSDIEQGYFSFTHEELALLTGINRVTASRVIENLKQADQIVPLGRGKYKIKERGGVKFDDYSN